MTVFFSKQEVAEFVVSLGSLPTSERSALQAIDDWAEHMRAGGFECGWVGTEMTPIRGEGEGDPDPQ